MFWLIDRCQNSVSADQYRLTVSWAQVSTHWVRVFFEFIRWQVATLQMIAGSSSIFFFYLIYKMKYSCYQDCSVIHGWFVYCAFCWQMHRLSKSLEIRFRMTSFSKMSLLTCPCLRGKRVEKSQAILEHLMTFGSSISTEHLLSLTFFFFFFRFPEVEGMVYAA